MEALAILLPVAAFVALAAGLIVVFRRTDSIARRSREIEAFKTAVRDLTARIETSLEGATSRIDAVRRQQAGAETMRPTIEAATDAVERYRTEVRALRGPAPTTAIRDALATDLDRAARALQMADHGAGMLTQGRRRGKEIEAQTSLKRGYLNLMHTREALERHAADAAALEIISDRDEGGTTAAVSGPADGRLGRASATQPPAREPHV